MSIGKGTKSGKELRGLIEEIEGVRDRKKQLSEQEKEIFQRGKAQGFDVKTIRAILTLRKLDVSKRQEQEALLDTYMHAIGMAEEPPLFVALGKFAVDLAAREEAVEFLKSICPPHGEIVLKLGGLPVRVFRDAEGKAVAEEVDEPAPTIKPMSRDDFDDTGRFPTEDVDGIRKSHVKSAADRAEEAAAAKRLRSDPKAPAPGSAPP
jgi:uncharacterized protein (UPF0335 family)